MPNSPSASDLSHLLPPDQLAAANTALAPQYDSARGLSYTVVDGKKYYQPPGGNPLSGQGADAGGWLHGHTVWDPEQGKYTNSLNWGKIAGWAALGIISYGAASSLMGSGAVAGSAAGGAGSTGALASSTIAPLASTLPGAASTSALVGGTAAAGATAPLVAPSASRILGGYAPLLSTGIGVGADLIGARMQTNASRDAAELQDKYLREALAYEKEKDAYERQRQAEQTQYDRTWKEGQYSDIVSRMQPYITAGGNAADRQARLLGLPSSPSPNQAPLTSGRVGAAPVTGGTSSNGFTLTPSPSGAVTPLPGAGMPAPVQGPAVQPAKMAAPEMVLLQSPNGSQKQVPADQVDYWIQKGATRVG